MISLSYYAGLISVVTNLFTLGAKAAQFDVPAGLTGKDKSWLPEGICNLVEIALVRNYPKGTKLHFEKHHIVLQSPQSGCEKSIVKDNLPPIGMVRWYNGDDKTDLIKLPIAIASGLAIMPPDTLPNSVDPAKDTAKEILDIHNISSSTKIHLFALDGIKALAKTYKIELDTLRSALDDKNDSDHEKYLKHSFQLLCSGLKGNRLTSPLSEVGKRVQQNWKPFEVDTVAHYLNQLTDKKWGSDTETQIRDTLNAILTKKLDDYKKFCEDASCSIVKEIPANPIPSAPVNIPVRRTSNSSSHNGTPSTSFQMILPKTPPNSPITSSLSSLQQFSHLLNEDEASNHKTSDQEDQ